MIDPAHEVVLGGLALMQDGKAVDYPEGYTLAVLGEGTTWGNPAPVVTTLFSMLSAGSLVSRDGDDNRPPVLLIEISCPLNDGNALALGEMALMGVCNHPVELEWLPPQAGAERAVFDVVDSSLKHVMDDIGELRVTRTWRVPMSALPYSRDKELTTTLALTIGGATEVPVSLKSLAANVATLTTATADQFIPGQQVVMAGVDATFNGTHTIIATPTATTFTYAKTAANVAQAAATGTATGNQTFLIDACDSTAGWSSTTATVTAVGGAVGSAPPPATDGQYAARAAGEAPGPYADLAKTGTFDFTATPYLVAEWNAAQLEPSATLELPNATRISEVATEVGWRKTYFRLSGVATLLPFSVGPYTYPYPYPPGFSIRNLSRTTLVGGVGTRRQLHRTFEVGGSAPTSGNIDLTHETSNLDDVIVFTYPAGLGYQPPLSPWYVSGPVRLPEPNLISGAYHSINTVSTWRIPAASLPKGEYLLVARLYTPHGPAVIPIDFAVSSFMNGVKVGPLIFDTALAPLENEVWQTVALGEVTLPPSRIGPNGFVHVEIVRSSMGTQDVVFDEGYLFNTKGSLTMLNNVPSKRLRISAPSLADPHGSIMVGNATDWSDAYSGSGLAASKTPVHVLVPGSNNIFTVAAGAPDAAASATHYDRSHTHPAAR